MIRRAVQFGILGMAYLALAGPALAAGPFDGARPVNDPAAASRAEYGRIDRPGEVRFYSVRPGQTISVTIEAVVPVRNASAEFRPAVAVITPAAGPASAAERRSPVPFSVPTGYDVRVIAPDASEPRRTLFDPNSIERFYRNGSESVTVPGGRTSYLAVYDPGGRTGDYVLGIASSPYFENASRRDLLAQGIALKFGAAAGRTLPWLDVTGALLAMLGLAAAGTVTLAAALPRPRAARRARRWRYLTAAGAFGSLLAYYAGLRILGRDTGMIAVASFQEILCVLLLLAVAWLALQPPDRPARRYRVFIALWSAGWLAQAALLAWYLLVTRTT